MACVDEASPNRGRAAVGCWFVIGALVCVIQAMVFWVPLIAWMRSGEAVCGTVQAVTPQASGVAFTLWIDEETPPQRIVWSARQACRFPWVLNRPGECFSFERSATGALTPTTRSCLPWFSRVAVAWLLMGALIYVGAAASKRFPRARRCCQWGVGALLVPPVVGALALSWQVDGALGCWLQWLALAVPLAGCLVIRRVRAKRTGEASACRARMGWGGLAALGTFGVGLALLLGEGVYQVHARERLRARCPVDVTPCGGWEEVSLKEEGWAEPRLVRTVLVHYTVAGRQYFASVASDERWPLGAAASEAAHKAVDRLFAGEAVAGSYALEAPWDFLPVIAAPDDHPWQDARFAFEGVACLCAGGFLLAGLVLWGLDRRQARRAGWTV